MSAVDRASLPPARLPVSAIFTDTFVIARRNVLFIIRTPQLLVFSTIQPVMFVLLFRFVFGGAISVPTSNYASYLLPGVFVQTVVFGSTTAAVALASDLKAGIIDRFRSLPMARSAVLAGRTAADAMRNVFVITLMIAVGYAVDFRFQGGFLSALGAMAIALLFGYAWSWFFALVFASSIFVSTATMPSWLQTFAENQPVTRVTNAVRGLALGTATTSDVVIALLWIGGMLLVFAPLATWRYRKG
jgi:ABC-2 type transport system permease protein/oleandomycin transport system permease protein